MHHRATTDNPATKQTSDQPPHTNSLIRETSPYLLQHAHNPVDWHAWGAHAFERARQEDKPIFLSIGYSTCYWCHVMERESFEDEATAAVLNASFICIKVDREERPDVDDIYMAATQAMTGSGGWPMSVFLEPRTLKPFYAGTYFPREPAFGRPSFTQLLAAINDAWTTRRDAIDTQADQIADAVRAQLAHQAQPRAIGESDVNRAVDALMSIYDPEHGGFGRAPKFPQPVFLQLLMAAAWERDDVRKAVLHTLDRMATGGMYDQVGGGFHRYSVDEMWLVPHFEKMLYDNGQLVSHYAEAFDRTGDEFYAKVVRETLAYIEREMTDENGGFYSAQDAEVDGREGLNYLWREAEIIATLREAGVDDQNQQFILRAYGLDRGPNFRDPHDPDASPANVLFLIDKPAALASLLGLSIDDVNQRLARINAVLLNQRSKRVQPGTDDKILCGWNGLMIAGFADAARVLREPRYAAAAARAADLILTHLRAEDGSLLRTWREGTAKVPAFLEDYALVIYGLIALHRANGDPRWLDECRTLVLQAEERFADDESGAYFDTLADQADLFVRTRSTHDGAVPSGNSVMLNNLLDLFELTGDESYLNSATLVLRGLSSTLAENPVGSALATLALHRFVQRWPQRLPADGERAPNRDRLRLGTPTAVAGPTPPSPVTIALGAAEITISPDHPATIDVTLEIAEGWHIIAHDPGDDRLVGLEFDLIGGEGLRLAADFPPGALLEDGDGSHIRAHHGRITIPLRIEQVGAVRGNPSLVITYQPCTQTACLKPVVQRLDVTLTIAHDKR